MSFIETQQYSFIAQYLGVYGLLDGQGNLFYVIYNINSTSLRSYITEFSSEILQKGSRTRKNVLKFKKLLNCRMFYKSVIILKGSLEERKLMCKICCKSG